MPFHNYRYGILSASHDSGCHWTPDESIRDSLYSFESLAFPSPSNGFIFQRSILHSEDDRIKVTNDSGKTWHFFKSQGVKGSIGNTLFFDSLNALLMAYTNTKCTIYKTTDGGRNWVNNYEGDLSLGLIKIYLAPDSHIYIIGKGIVLQDSSATSGVIKFQKQSLSVNIYPNPSQGEIYLQCFKEDNEPVKFTIRDVLGKEVYKSTLSIGMHDNSAYKVNAGTLSPGVYLYTVMNEHGTLSGKLVVE